METLDSVHDDDLTLPSPSLPSSVALYTALRAMWGWNPLMIMLFIGVASPSHVLPRDVTLTWTWSTYLSTGFITQIMSGRLTTETYIAHTEYNATATFDDQGNRVIATTSPASTTAPVSQSPAGNTPTNHTPTPTPQPSPATVTVFRSSTPSATSSMLQQTLISTSTATSPTVQNVALSVPQSVVPAPAASSLSIHDAVSSTSPDAAEGTGLSKSHMIIIIGGTIAGFAVIGILLLAVYLKRRRLRKATCDLFSPVNEPPNGSVRDSMMIRIAPFHQSRSPSTPYDQGQSTAASVSTSAWSSTNLLSSLHPDTSYSRSETKLSGCSINDFPLPLVDLRPSSPPPHYTA